MRTTPTPLSAVDPVDPVDFAPTTPGTPHGHRQDESVGLETLARALRARRAATLEAAAAGEARLGAQPLPPRIVARLAPAQEAALANVRMVEARRKASRSSELMRVLAIRASETRIGAKERVLRLRKLYDAWARDVHPHSACRQGCFHCCHIGVAVSRSEAELIAKETGARLQALPHEDGPQALLNMQRATEDLAARPRPCTFLAEDGRCSIYSSRPLACRQLHNMDVDALLCELIPGAAVPVPYADATELDVLTVTALPDWRQGQVADIRQWFGERRESPA
jgi:hypothetical protein